MRSNALTGEAWDCVVILLWVQSGQGERAVFGRRLVRRVAGLEKTKVRGFCVLNIIKGILGENGAGNFGGFGGEFCTLLVVVEGRVCIRVC
jgi:hypothetical protein